MALRVSLPAPRNRRFATNTLAGAAEEPPPLAPDASPVEGRRAAERIRKRQLRRRMREGIRWMLSVPATDDLRDRLVADSWLTEEEAETDRSKCQEALRAFLEDLTAPREI